jgi:hypothetical protein
MAKKKATDKQEAANAKAEKKRRANAEKQARFRQSMKEKGYKEIRTWERQPEPGMVKPWGELSPPHIRESTVGICERDPAVKKAVDRMMSAFLATLRGEDETLDKEQWNIYRDIETLLSPLGHEKTV